MTSSSATTMPQARRLLTSAGAHIIQIEVQRMHSLAVRVWGEGGRGRQRRRGIRGGAEAPEQTMMTSKM